MVKWNVETPLHLCQTETFRTLIKKRKTATEFFCNFTINKQKNCAVPTRVSNKKNENALYTCSHSLFT